MWLELAELRLLQKAVEEFVKLDLDAEVRDKAMSLLDYVTQTADRIAVAEAKWLQESELDRQEAAEAE